MSLGKLLVRKAVKVQPKDSLATAAKLMEKENVGAVVVAEAERPVGIVTDRDLALATCVHGASADAHVQSVMTCPVSTIREDEGLFDATQQMMELAVRRLPVVDQLERLVGLISLDDLLLLLSRELHNVAEGVRTEVATPQ
jgi:signal-transduction protein with cAMP-binding, CBS, and nucleotidyltransferase domain